MPPRTGTVVGIFGVLLGVILAVQLAFNFHGSSRANQFSRSLPLQSTRADKSATEDDIFNVGIGKADVTGVFTLVLFIIENPHKPDDTLLFYLGTRSRCWGYSCEKMVVLQGGLAAMGAEITLDTNLTNLASVRNPLPMLDQRGSQGPGPPTGLSFDTKDLVDGNINRSPYSYLANPEEERKRYQYDTDKTLSLIRFDRASDDKTTGILTFYSVHGTSLFANNTLVSGDNKGVAAYLFERAAKGDDRFAEGFIAGFSQSSVGDTSPNTLGPFCEDTGLDCKFEDSTCGGSTAKCHGRGPFFRELDQGTKSCFEIGRRQYNTAKEIYENMDTSAKRIRDNSAVKAFHVYQDFDGYTFPSPFNPRKTLTTCSAALGFSFAGGTTDGPGRFDFTQNGTDSPSTKNPIWRIARDVIHAPSKEQIACQKPKKILLDIGDLTFPYAWAANIIDIQVLRAGPLFIIVATPEVSTMSGRRWKQALVNKAKEVLGVSNPLVVLGAPSNTYAHYVTTEEEYGIQRYEGGSTLHGPNTLAAHVNLTLTYLPFLSASSNNHPDPGPYPPINSEKSLSFISGVVHDNPPIGKKFGDVLKGPEMGKTFRPGDTVNTTFVGANPRNNFRLEKTYTAVERQVPNTNRWEVVRDDSDWNLVYRWERKRPIIGTSEVTLEWTIEDDYYSLDNKKKLESGTYRLHYYGDSKAPVTGQITAFEGIGPAFKVEA
ncbi:ceramidase [Trichophyton tonsurans CBS 112818]|uniref:Neutral ceramidase n=1 Tax=Trichophyton tonsurans (strain CBS 112818) TaxID=647933 RepID=F2S0J5_TRIT1|nr:ceramidase [Trichophyton tonsurans CBS 112818]